LNDPLNLTGKWDGVFKYPRDLPTTPFLAELSEDAGAFTGTTMEPDLYKPSSAGAIVSGHRSVRSIDFTKTYQRKDPGYSSPIDYVGQMSEDGQRITGVWTMQDWDGEFEMHREAQLEIEAEGLDEVEI